MIERAREGTNVSSHKDCCQNLEDKPAYRLSLCVQKKKSLLAGSPLPSRLSTDYACPVLLPGS